MMSNSDPEEEREKLPISESDSDSDIRADDCEDDHTKEDEDIEDNEEDNLIRNHHSYEQVMLDVNRCAGRLQRMRQVYFHRTDEDDESPEDLTEELELQNIASRIGRPVEELVAEQNEDAIVNQNFRDKQSRKESNTTLEDLHNQRLLKKKLAKLIVGLLIRKPDLHYYQGFHDVCLTYMTMFGEEGASKRLDKIIDSHFSPFMQPTMNKVQDYLALIPIIIGLHDHKLQEFLMNAEVGTIFALSWVITWFSHVIPNEHEVVTIFRYLEKQDPHFVLYLCAEIVIFKRDRLLELEPEMSTVHHFLCQVPRKEKLPIEQLLDRANKSFSRWSPEYVKQKLDDYRSSKLRLHNYNILRTLANRLGPTISNIVASNAKTAIIVVVLASAFVFQLDRWSR